MVGFCKACGEAGSVHRTYRLCGECWDERGQHKRKDAEPDTPAVLAPLASEPTCYAPGTPGKVSVIEERGKRKEQLFHPCDARYSGDKLPVVFMRATPEERAALIESSAREQREKIEKLFANPVDSE